MKIWSLGWVGAGIALACGNGGDESAEGVEAPGASGMGSQIAPALPASVRQLRVDLAGTNAAPRIVRARLLDVPADTVPLPSLVGTAVLVGYTGAGSPSVATPFSFPTVMHVERSRDGAQPGEDVPLSEASLSLFVDAREELSRIDVLGETGAVLASLSAVEFEPVAPEPKLRLLQVAGTPSPRDTLQSAFPHIEFLGPGGELGIMFDNPISDVLDVIEIGNRAGPPIQDALSRMSKMALGAVRTVAVANFKANAPIGLTYGSTVVINSLIDTDPGELSQTVVHESTHAFQFLINGDLSLYLLNRRPWPQDVRDAAQRTIQDFSLQSGITAAWEALQGDAVEDGIAGDYLGSGWLDLGTDGAADIAAAPLGFATAYGASNADDDQAEYVARLVVPEYGKSPVCDLVKNAGDPFPVARTLPYIKIKLLEGLSLLSASQVTACVGQPALEGPPGIHLGDSVALTQSIRGGFVDLDEGRFFGVLASGAPYQMLIRVRAPEQQPRGIYRLDDIGYSGINAATNAVLLGHDTEPLRARTSARGLVLVTEYGPQRLAGAVFFLMLRNAAGVVTDSFPFGTFRVDNPI